jgi:hypothetical protein
VVLNVTNKYLHTHQIPEKVEEAASPPLTPLSQRVSTLPELASHSSEIQGKVLFLYLKFCINLTFRNLAACLHIYGVPESAYAVNAYCLSLFPLF